ncbi:MAG: zinc-ribbon domain-containing protein [Peptoclostridium sp.]|uniref:zinc ribbon domain-containing protein n=1 Tax=Peptoclostridium sp. TaxID=1904860 RepID=UPI00139E2319|nr:zinc ribbon domain-containing protein [Peptoclostridium sp.]MZQ74936.1 zinc-ribbon domain-containing protein [Peptoclostridium sp.]
MSKFCAQCGSPLSPDSKFCESCGSKIDDQCSVQEEPKPSVEQQDYDDAESEREFMESFGEQPRKGGFGKAIFISLIVVLLAVAGIWAAFFREQPPTVQTEGNAAFGAKTQPPSSTEESEAADRFAGNWVLKYWVYEEHGEAGISAFESRFDMKIAKLADGKLSVELVPSEASINGEAYPADFYSGVQIKTEGYLEGDKLCFALEKQLDHYIDPYTEFTMPMQVKIPMQESDGMLSGIVDMEYSNLANGASKATYMFEAIKQ